MMSQIRGGLNVAKLVDEARTRTGLNDFGPDTWQEGLQALVDALNTEAALTPHGEAFNAERLVEKLVERLKFEHSYSEHPEISEEQIIAPLIGVGLGRTGSTALSFILGQDPNRRMLRTWEASTPSPPPEKATERSDPRIARARSRIEANWQAFPGSQGRFPQDAEGPTECVFPMALDFRSQMYETWGRVPSYSDWLFNCDMELAYLYHRRIHQMLQWRCGPRTWYMRTPSHMHAMRELDRVYPDARFVMTHRNIDSILPSGAEMWAAVIHPLTNEPDPHYLGRHLPKMRAETLRRLIAFRDDGNEHRFFDIAFSDMQTDPMTQIRKLYAWLGEDLTEATAERMEAWYNENSRERHGSRRYDAEIYGMSVEGLREQFAFYHERFPAFTRGSGA